MKHDEELGVSHLEHTDRDIKKGIKRTPAEANVALDQLFSLELNGIKRPFNKILIASNSLAKQNFLSKTLEPFGITVIAPEIGEQIPESEYQEALRELETPADKYAPRLAARKLTNFMEAVRSGMPVIAFDTVVVTNSGQVLEKPHSLDEARQTITELTSKGDNPISVIDGVTFAISQGNEHPFIYRTASEITFLLNAADEEEIKDYLEQQGSLVMGIAGGIDFASVPGRKFINPNTPYHINKGKSGQLQSPEGSFNSTKTENSGVLVAESTSSVLEPYFRGVPTHLVRGIINSVRQ